MRRENLTVFHEVKDRNPIRVYYDKVGLPTFVDERTDERVILPPTVFFADEKLHQSRDTLRRYATEIYYWLCFCDANGFQYMNASENQMRHYKLWLVRSQKPDGNALQNSTVDGRIYRVLEFYRWAKTKEIFFGSLGPGRRPTRTFAWRSSEPQWQRAGQVTRQAALEGSAFLSRNTTSPIVRPLTRTQISACHKVLNTRSADVSLSDGSDPEADRDRLIFDLMWQCGLRRGEVASSFDLTSLSSPLKTQFLREEVRFSICGKGNKIRSVALPKNLVQRLQAYVRGERQDSVRAGTQSKDSNNSCPQNAIFLTHARSTRPGQNLSRERISCLVKDIFQAADIASQGADFSGAFVNRLCNHSAHDLRHTFAVLLYYALRAQSVDRDSALKQIQLRLGHSSVSTTEEYYARFTDEFRSYDDFCRHLSQ